jgi:DNA invertase Pin-like site-specific DNA recombinase
LEAQREAVAQYAKANGLKIDKEFIETETGKISDRPQLQAAMLRVKALNGNGGGLLVIAKLDRLSRNVAFTSALMESGVEFVACDNPHATRFTIHILAAVAEHEAQLISQRTKAALAVVKKPKSQGGKGKKLGAANPNFKNAWRKRGSENGIAKAQAKAAAERAKRQAEHSAPFIDDVRAWKAAGLSYDAIAAKLNERDQLTVQGKPYTAKSVWRLLN